MSTNIKLTIARKMLTKKEISDHVPPYLGKAWSDRQKARLQKELKKHEEADARKEKAKKERQKKHQALLKEQNRK